MKTIKNKVTVTKQVLLFQMNFECASDTPIKVYKITESDLVSVSVAKSSGGGGVCEREGGVW